MDEGSGAFPPDTARVFWRVFPSVALPIYVAVGDQTIVASALPAIAGSLGDVERVSWIVIAYLIASTIAAPIYGYLGDVFGRRRMLFIALTIFMCGSLMNAFAPSVTALAASRFFQGLGGGGLMSMAQALLGEVIPPRERGKYQGYNATVFVTAAALGPVIGAVLTAQFGWRSVFFINIPVGILAFVMAFRLENRRGRRSDDWAFDYGGLFFFVSFIVPLLIALEQVRRFNLGSLLIIAMLIGISVISLVLLVRQERRVVAPLMPIKLMRQRAIWNAQLMIACHGATMTALIAFLPLFVRVRGIGGIHDVGWLLLLFSASIAGSSILVGRMVTRTGKTMIFPGIFQFFATLLFVFFALFAADFSLRGLFVSSSLLAIAMGATMTVTQVTIQSQAGRRNLGAASGSIQLARTVGAVFGTALFGTLLFATLALRDPQAGAMFGQILNAGPEALTGVSEVRKAAVMGGIVQGFSYAFFMLAAVSAMATVLAWTNPVRRV